MREYASHLLDQSVLTSTRFTQLNGDVLVRIFEELRLKKGLRHLSSTCRWLRRASTPVLFGECRQYLGEIPWEGANYEILPSTLWSHIRSVGSNVPFFVDVTHSLLGHYISPAFAHLTPKGTQT